jgi:hypothetical protein
VILAGLARQVAVRRGRCGWLWQAIRGGNRAAPFSMEIDMTDENREVPLYDPRKEIAAESDAIGDRYSAAIGEAVSGNVREMLEWINTSSGPLLIQDEQHYVDLLDTVDPAEPVIGFATAHNPRMRPERNADSLVTIRDVLAILREVNRQS